MRETEYGRFGAAGVIFAGLAICLLAAVSASMALGAKGDLDLGSRQSDAAGGAGANSWSYEGSLSDDGRFLAFRSEATNLDVEDSGSFETTVYVYDFDANTVETVSRESNLGPPAAGDSREEEISGNGRFVVFRTDAQNLGGPIVADENVYVYDRRKDEVELISRRSEAAGGEGADADSGTPTISANGRYVSFQTRSTNLGGPITDDGFTNVYVRDRKKERTFLVSRRSDGGKGGKDDSFEPSIAPDATVVAFESQARNLGGPIKDSASANVYVHDWSTGKTSMVSRRSDGGAGVNSSADVPDVSASGRYVAFQTAATNLGGPISGTADQTNLYLHDRKKGTTKLVSRQSKNDGGQGVDGNALRPSLSNSGRYVAFQTSATNLGGPILASSNSYAYDRKRKVATLVSRAGGGGPGADEAGTDPAIAGGGGFVAFTTAADNIDPPGQPAYHGNFPPATNVYRFQLRP